MNTIVQGALETVKALVSAVTGRDPAEMTSATRFIEDLNCDSLDKIEIAMAVEDECRVSFTDAEIDTVRTLDDLVTLVGSKR